MLNAELHKDLHFLKDRNGLKSSKYQMFDNLSF